MPSGSTLPDVLPLSWLAQGTADDSDITPYGKEQAVRVRNALSSKKQQFCCTHACWATFLIVSALQLTCCAAHVRGCVFPSTRLHHKRRDTKKHHCKVFSHTCVTNEHLAAVCLAAL